VAASDATHNLSVAVTAVRAGYQDALATTLPVTVPKLKSTTSVFALPTTVTRTQRSKLSISISAIGASGPTGTVVIRDGRKKIKSLSLTAAKNGRLTFKMPRFKKIGKHKIKVSYSGNGYIEGSKAKTVIVKVTR
jgi:hypothetical protein